MNAAAGLWVLAFFMELGGSFAASISPMASHADNGSAEEEPPVLACEAAVDSTLAPSDIVANVCRVCEHTPRRRGISHVVPRLGTTNLVISPRFCFWCIGVCVSWCVCSLCCEAHVDPVAVIHTKY